MTVDITVPQLGESVTEATVATWFKKQGDAVKMDEALVELETDKVTMEVYAPADGVLEEVVAGEGADVEVGALLARLKEGAVSAPAAIAEPETKVEPEPAAAVVAETAEAVIEADDGDMALSPAVHKLIEEHGLDPSKITGTGKDGRLLKGDVLAYLDAAAEKAAAPVKVETSEAPKRARGSIPSTPADPEGREKRVKMTRLRRSIAERLKAAQETAAMLTTFNEVDMTAVMAARKEYRDRFEKKHGVRLGFMSYFVKAAVRALKDIPAVNGEIAGDEIVYKHYYHIGVAVSSAQGLVVPVLRDADGMSFAEIEQNIAELGRKARDGELTTGDLTGGTFTISNGGIFGSLMSTPILNPPQSAILGMHKIQERPVVVDGAIEARPMMYLALSYDHRIIDGREAVTFLVRIKDAIEDPQRLLLDI